MSVWTASVPKIPDGAASPARAKLVERLNPIALRHFRRMADHLGIRPFDQLAAAIADRPARDLYETGTAASYSPILQSPDCVSEKFGGFLFIDKPVQIGRVFDIQIVV